MLHWAWRRFGWNVNGDQRSCHHCHQRHDDDISIKKTKASREWREGKGASLARTKKGQPTPSSLFPKKRAPSQRLLLLFQWKFGKIDHVFWNLDHICLFEDSIFVFLRYSIFTHIHKCIIYVSHTYSWGQILVPLVVPEALLLSPNTCLAECLNVGH